MAKLADNPIGRRLTGNILQDYERRVSNKSDKSDDTSSEEGKDFVQTIAEMFKDGVNETILAKVLELAEHCRDQYKDLANDRNNLFQHYEVLLSKNETLQTDLKSINKDLHAAYEEVQEKEEGMNKLRDMITIDRGSITQLQDRLTSIMLIPAASDRKPTALPHPKDSLTDGKDPDVEDFIQLIRNKFNAEPWNFPTENLKIGYITNYCRGDAMNLLRARLRPDSNHKFTTGEEVLDVLQRGLGKHAEVKKEEAQAKLLSLYQNTTPFYTFWAKLEALCTELGKTDADVLVELKFRMSIEMQQSMHTVFTNDLVEYVKACHLVASRNEVIQKNKTRFATSNRNRLNHRPNPTSRAPDTKSLRCYLCNKEGHISKDCPEKKLFDTKKKPRILVVEAEDKEDDSTDEQEEESEIEQEEDQGKEPLHT